MLGIIINRMIKTTCFHWKLQPFNQLFQKICLQNLYIICLKHTQQVLRVHLIMSILNHFFFKKSKCDGVFLYKKKSLKYIASTIWDNQQLTNRFKMQHIELTICYSAVEWLSDSCPSHSSISIKAPWSLHDLCLCY